VQGEILADGGVASIDGRVDGRECFAYRAVSRGGGTLRRDGDDVDRVRVLGWLHDGADAGAGEDHRVPFDIFARQERHFDDDQRDAAGARLSAGHGTGDPDRHTDSCCR
jgi:hypothetical protein